MVGSNSKQDPYLSTSRSDTLRADSVSRHASKLENRTAVRRLMRCKHEIEADVLDAINAGTQKRTLIMYKTGLNCTDFKKAESRLLSRGFIEKEPATTPKRTIFILTRKGARRLARLREVA